MYKVASDKRQAGLHHGKPADWVNGVEKLSPHDRLRQLGDGIRILNSRIIESHGKPGKRKLILEKTRMEAEVALLRRELGVERKGAPMDNFGQMFVECSKQILSPVQFNIIKAATKRELERLEKDAAAPAQNAEE